MARPSSILRSRHKEEIEECLRSGWSPETVVWWLKRRDGDDDPDAPSVRAVYRYRKQHIPTNAIVPASILRQKLKDLDYKVDLLNTLGRISWALEQRFATSWEREQEKSQALATPNTDRAALTLLEYLREYRAVAQDLGIMPAQAEQLRVEMYHTQTFEVREEDLPELVEALALTKGRLPPGRLEED